MKKTVAVIFGGKSVEHDVSIITAHVPIIEALLASNEYNVLPIYISKDGSWYSESSMNNLSYFKDKELDIKINKLKKLHLIFDNGFSIAKTGIISKPIKIDIVFPAMHGTYGEDGSLMGLLRMAGVPYVGCDLFASSIAMDKVATKQILEDEGIQVVPYTWFTKSDWEINKKVILDKINNLTWPVFVKPVHLGSSIAITKVSNKNDLENAIEVALHYDNKVLVEEAVENLIEVTLPIIGNAEPELGYIEKALNKSEFFNFEDKYISGNKKTPNMQSQYSEIPAKIDDSLYKLTEKIGKQTYKIIGCSGIARIDFLINN
ncbi:MAG: D-alanine--D-alanine ligase, partial [Bacteroidetes bacterium]|nr:D-alanine--D-alanine ligase [Bacteroidota bacterium]